MLPPPAHPPPARPVASLCRRLKDASLALGRPKAALLPLRAALQKLCPTPEHLSPMHADLFQL